jgi:hypothetical protein
MAATSPTKDLLSPETRGGRRSGTRSLGTGGQKIRRRTAVAEEAVKIKVCRFAIVSCYHVVDNEEFKGGRGLETASAARRKKQS